MFFHWFPRVTKPRPGHQGRRGGRYDPRLELLEDRRLLNAGALDPTFGTGGIVTGSFPDFSSTALCPVLLPGGDILVLTGPRVQRLLPNGAPDTSFGTGGAVSLDFSPSALALQADGNFVVVGRTVPSPFTPGHFQVERFTAGGALDATFGTGGRVITAFGTNDSATAVALQRDGKILVVGADNLPTNPDFWDPNQDFAIERLNPDGSLDGSFGAGGKVTLDFGTSADEAVGVVVQPDGKVVVAGNARGPTLQAQWAFALGRLNPDGSLDGSFGAGGEVTTRFAPNGEFASGLALQGDGKILVSGSATDGSSSLVRYLPDGSLDATFGTGGQVQTPSFVAAGLALQADGKAVVAGARSINGTTSNFALARFLLDGTLDPGFGTGGVVTTDLGTASASASTVIVQADGTGEKLLAAGTFFAPNSPAYSYGLVRYLGSDVPTTPNQSFVDQIYRDLLGRPAEGAALTGWGGWLDRGATRAWLVGVVEKSPEYLGRVVEGLYHTLLGRPADAPGLSAFVNLLASGASVEQARALILGSEEYFQRAGGSDAGLVDALYRDVLGRSRGTTEGQVFVDALAAGLTRAEVAAAIVTSREADQDVVAADYRRFLHREGDAAGLAAFTEAMQLGESEEQVVAALVSSPEYLGDIFVKMPGEQ
jgi:uncharacterized delta-60 repeat protein